MCDHAEFARIREAIGELQKADAVQSEQIKTLFNVTSKQGNQQDKLTARLVFAAIVALLLALGAVIYGALGPRGFNAVTSAMRGQNFGTTGTTETSGTDAPLIPTQRMGPSSRSSRPSRMSRLFRP